VATIRGGEPDTNSGGPSWANMGFRAEKEGSHVEEAEFSMPNGGGWEPGPADTAKAEFPIAGPMVSEEEPQPVNIGVTAPERRPRRVRVPCGITELSEGSFGDISEYETEEEDDANT
jgi:hypothetical protein